MGHLSDTTAPLYKDHLSIEATVDCSMGHLSDTTAPLYKDHLSIVTTVDCSMSASVILLHLCIRTTCLQRPPSLGPLSGRYAYFIVVCWTPLL